MSFWESFDQAHQNVADGYRQMLLFWSTLWAGQSACEALFDLLTQKYREVLALSILSTYGCWNSEVSVHLVGCLRSGAFDIPRVHDIQFCHMRADSEILEFE